MEKTRTTSVCITPQNVGGQYQENRPHREQLLSFLCVVFFGPERAVLERVARPSHATPVPLIAATAAGNNTNATRGTMPTRTRLPITNDIKKIRLEQEQNKRKISK